MYIYIYIVKSAIKLCGIVHTLKRPRKGGKQGNILARFAADSLRKTTPVAPARHNLVWGSSSALWHPKEGPPGWGLEEGQRDSRAITSGGEGVNDSQTLMSYRGCLTHGLRYRRILNTAFVFRYPMHANALVTAPAAAKFEFGRERHLQH